MKIKMDQSKIQRYRQSLNGKVKEWGNSKDIRFSQIRGMRHVTRGLGDILTQETNFKTYLGVVGALSPVIFWYNYASTIDPNFAENAPLTIKLAYPFYMSILTCPLAFVASWRGYERGYKSGKKIDEL